MERRLIRTGSCAEFHFQACSYARLNLARMEARHFTMLMANCLPVIRLKFFWMQTLIISIHRLLANLHEPAPIGDSRPEPPVSPHR